MELLQFYRRWGMIVLIGLGIALLMGPAIDRHIPWYAWPLYVCGWILWAVLPWK